MNRRDFLLLKVASSAPHSAVLSCETLYMRFLDARVQGRTEQLFDVLRQDLANTDSVVLSEVAWLSDEALRAHVSGLLDEFRARGGRVES